MKSFLLILVALSSASAFVAPQLTAPHGAAFRQLEPKRSTAFLFGRGKEETLEKEEIAVEEATDGVTEDETVAVAEATTDAAAKEEDEEEMSESEKLLKQVKEAGTAGVISYAAWELAFWALSVPVCVVGYKVATGHFPDLTNSDDQAKLGAEAFAFVNFARFAVPLRIGLALGTTPWVQENIVDRFMTKDGEGESS